MYYCACNNIFFLFSHFFRIKLPIPRYFMRGHDLPFLLIDTNNTAMIFHERDLLFCGKFISPASNEAAFKREMNIRGDDFLLEGIFDLPITRTFYSFLSVWGKGLKDKRETNNISLYLSLGRCLWGAFNFRPSSFLPTIRG